MPRCSGTGRSVEDDNIECLDLEATHHVHAGLGLGEDHRAAAQAFVNKTQVVFTGR